MGFLMFIPLGVFIFFFTADSLVEFVKADVDNYTWNTNTNSAASNSTNRAVFQSIHSDNNQITEIYTRVFRASSVTVGGEIFICSEINYTNKNCNNPIFYKSYTPAEITSTFGISSTTQIGMNSSNLLSSSSPICVIPNKEYWIIYRSLDTGNLSNNWSGRSTASYASTTNPFIWQNQEYSAYYSDNGILGDSRNTTFGVITQTPYYLKTTYSDDCQATSTININISESSGSSTATMPSTAATTCNVPEASSLTAITSCTAVNEEGVNYTTYYLPILAWLLVGGFILLVGWNLIKIMFHKYDRQ